MVRSAATPRVSNHEATGCAVMIRPSGICSKASQSGERIQHPLQMLIVLRSSGLSCSLTAARAAERGDLDAANRVRLIFTAPCTGNVR